MEIAYIGVGRSYYALIALATAHTVRALHQSTPSLYGCLCPPGHILPPPRSTTLEQERDAGKPPPADGGRGNQITPVSRRGDFSAVARPHLRPFWRARTSTIILPPAALEHNKKPQEHRDESYGFLLLS